MREVLSYPLGPVPWCLSTQDGTPVKTQKAPLMKLLGEVQGNYPPTGSSPSASALMLDAMALLQSITQKQVPETFSERAEHIFTVVARNFTNYSRIDFVADNYPDVSIKNVERGR